ncbi:MAG: hypothetical protein U1C54_09325 [Xanthomonadaceae bacterium]|jgi:hypothetical protein|nr:hypothetical protein [Xanthomonadaceae bacterium]MDZ4377120.1 hypothetical protein [Xanthomonadaceae bacterium]
MGNQRAGYTNRAGKRAAFVALPRMARALRASANPVWPLRIQPIYRHSGASRNPF